MLDILEGQTFSRKCHIRLVGILRIPPYFYPLREGPNLASTVLYAPQSDVSASGRVWLHHGAAAARLGDLRNAELAASDPSKFESTSEVGAIESAEHDN